MHGRSPVDIAADRHRAALILCKELEVNVVAKI